MATSGWPSRRQRGASLARGERVRRRGGGGRRRRVDQAERVQTQTGRGLRLHQCHWTRPGSHVRRLTAPDIWALGTWMGLWLGTSSSMMMKVEKFIYITAGKKIPCFSFLPRSSAPAYPPPLHIRCSPPCPLGDARSCLVGAIPNPSCLALFLATRSSSSFKSPCVLLAA